MSSVRFHGAPYRALREINKELAKRSFSQLNQYSGFDTLGGMGLGKRSDADQAGEKRAALSTFDSIGGMLQLRSTETFLELGYGTLWKT